MISVTLTLIKHDQLAPRHSMKLKHLLKVHYQNREIEVRSITKGSIVATGALIGRRFVGQIGQIIKGKIEDLRCQQYVVNIH